MKGRIALWVFALSLMALPLVAQETPAPAPAPTPVPAAAPAPAPAPAVPSIPRAYLDKLRVVVDGRAEANGAVGLEFLAVGGEPKAFTVRILAKASAKDIARDIHKELSLVAGGGYKVKLSGDQVKVTKQNKKAPNVSLVLTQLAVPGVSVLVKKG
jgi:hypothetical protein